MEQAKQKGKKAGLICFVVLIVIWILPIFLSLMVAPETLNKKFFIQFFIGTGIIAFLSAFFGFSMATKSRFLKIFSSILLASIPIYWILNIILTS